MENGNSLLELISDFVKESREADNKIFSNSHNRIFVKVERIQMKLSECLSESWNTDFSLRTSGSGDAAERTPDKNKNNQKVFHKFSPLALEKSSHSCQYCNFTSQLARKLREHMRDKHKDKQVDKSATDPKGTCRAQSVDDPNVQCGAKFETHQINRHLKVT